MATTFKTFDQALAELALAYWGSLGLEPDLVEGSIERSLLEAVAFQVSDLSKRFDRALQSAIPQAVSEATGFPREGAKAATLTLRFSGSAGATIPTGTLGSTSDGIEFRVTTDVAIAIGGSYVDVQAVAVDGGTSGNVAIGAVSRLASNVTGVTSVTNITAGTGGRDAESLDEQQARFADYLVSLDRSSIPAITLSLLSVSVNGERVEQVLVVDGQDDGSIPAGTFRFYPYKAGGIGVDLAQALLDEARDARAAGAFAESGTVTETAVPVTATIDTPSTSALVAAEVAAQQYLSDLAIGEKASRENLITALTTAHHTIREVTLTAPAADVTATAYEKLALGTLTITSA